MTSATIAAAVALAHRVRQVIGGVQLAAITERRLARGAIGSEAGDGASDLADQERGARDLAGRDGAPVVLALGRRHGVEIGIGNDAAIGRAPGRDADLRDRAGVLRAWRDE